MPQGRRKVPFSGKAKKEQLKAKREHKLKGSKNIPFLQKSAGDSEDEGGSSVQKINFQPTGNSSKNRYVLQFFRESDAEIRAKKEQARKTLVQLAQKDLEINADNFFDENLDFPKRPPWNFNMSKEMLEAQENRYFREYLKQIEETQDLQTLSYFELNLETWRQLWRVLEMSDIILFIVDIRFPAVMFPPSLYSYVTKDLHKDFILVLNKIDLAPPPLVVAWQHYFHENYPLLKISMFTSIPRYNLVGGITDKGELKIRKRKGHVRMAAEGTQKLFEICKSLVGDKIDLTTWENKIKEEMEVPDNEDDKLEIGETKLNINDTDFYEYKKFNGGILTIGCVGQPNVGKSSLMNAIMGKKVVSVSKTPGHTKHFQTIYLTNNVCLCDCPGLVFPSKVPKPLQVILGSFPIAQLREPYSTIQFLAERLDLVKMLKIEHPYNDESWSAMDICDGWAKKKGYITAKAGRLDSYRAANSILRMALDGKICLCLKPIGYNEKKEIWESHPDIELVKWIEAVKDDMQTHHYHDLPRILTNDNDTEENSDDDTTENENLSEASSDEELIATNKFATLDDQN